MMFTLVTLLGADAHDDGSAPRRRLATGSSEGYNFMFYFVIGAMMLTCLIYNIFFKHKMEAGFLRQHALPETMLRQDVIASDQEMNHLWECEVCSFKSYDAHKTCMLCGTDRSFKLVDKQSRSIEEGMLESGSFSAKASTSAKYVLYVDEGSKVKASSKSAAQAGSKPSSKISREFFKRKLSGLNLRQQSARRRHEWVRQRTDDGHFVWVRKKNYLDRKVLKSLRSLSSSSLRESMISVGSANSIGIVSRIVVSPKNPTGRIELDAPDGANASRCSDSSQFSAEELEQASVDHLMYYQAIGRFIGRALFEGILIDAHLALPLCKHILGVPITFSDLEFVDNDLYKNLKWLRDNPGVESLALDFTIDLPRYDSEKDLRIALSLVIQMEVTGFTIE
ncbi:hypothetical protein PybrP1_010913 [[Pythium] brassicae (nom. inval.)]|nr:hypothetical protein PybrP1_010913 [[Pythium] brassicae (nom. inval.)]